MRYVCEWDYMEPPHGKEAMNTEQKRAIALGGYDKYPPLVGLAQITHGWRNLCSIYLRQCRGERHEPPGCDNMMLNTLNLTRNTLKVRK